MPNKFYIPDKTWTLDRKSNFDAFMKGYIEVLQREFKKIEVKDNFMLKAGIFLDIENLTRCGGYGMRFRGVKTKFYVQGALLQQLNINMMPESCYQVLSYSQLPAISSGKSLPVTVHQRW